MRHRLNFRSILAFLAIFSALGVPVDRGVAAPLSRKALQRIEFEVIPAWEVGDTPMILQSLSRLTQKMDADQLQALDSELQAQGIPPAADVMTNARLTLIQQGFMDLPAPHQREILLAIPFLRDSTRDLLAEIRRHAVMADPIDLPKSLAGYERLFWEVHVFENQIRSAIHICEYGGILVRKGGTSRVDGLTDDEKDLLDTNFSVTSRKLEEMANELEERKLELRLHRLDRAEKVLATSDKFIEKLQAAYVLDLDGELLANALNGSLEHFTRPALHEEGLADRIVQRADKARNAHPTLTEKGRLFFTGLHWWLRGRYGSGPDGGGLLKHPAAINNDEALFGLFMPKGFQPPKANKPLVVAAQEKVAIDKQQDLDQAARDVGHKLVDGTSPDNQPLELNGKSTDEYVAEDDCIPPDFKRRHHYSWRYEYRQIATNIQSRVYKNAEVLSVKGTRTKLSRFY